MHLPMYVCVCVFFFLFFLFYSDIDIFKFSFYKIFYNLNFLMNTLDF